MGLNVEEQPAASPTPAPTPKPKPTPKPTAGDVSAAAVLPSLGLGDARAGPVWLGLPENPALSSPRPRPNFYSGPDSPLQALGD